MTTAQRATARLPVDRRALSRRLLIAGAVSAVLAAITYVLMVRTHLGQRFDDAALQGSEQQDITSRLRETFFLERISAGSLAIVLIGIFVIGIVRRRRVLGTAAAAAALLSVVVVDVLKDVVLTRPVLLEFDAFRPTNSFPSGHAATAIGCAMALVVLSPPSIRGIVAILVGSYSWVVAADVEAAGWHRPSDAIGAAMVTFAVVCVIAAVVVRIRQTGIGVRLAHIPAFVVLGGVWLVSLGLAARSAVRVLRVLASRSDSAALTRSGLNDAYNFSTSFTVTVVVTALITLLLLLGPYDLDEPVRPGVPEPTMPSASGP